MSPAAHGARRVVAPPASAPRVALLDVSAVFGPYTYLASEVAFGAVALALLWYTGALRRAARTVVALYPVAYVWDWYTLTIGVFSVELRTGVEFLGIPVEEHLFMVVVPALVVGFHEFLNGRPGARSDVTAGAEADGGSARDASGTTSGDQPDGGSARDASGTTSGDQPDGRSDGADDAAPSPQKR